MSTPLPDLAKLISHITLYSSENAYRQLFGILYPSLYRFCYCLLKSRELAEETANDVMITLWRNRGKLTEIQNIRVYTFVIAKNLSLNLLNKGSRQQLLSLDDVKLDIVLDTLNPEQLLINGELRQKLENATQSLPNRCKLVFKLIKEDGLSYRETAEILNISVKTVDAHLVIAVKKLTSILKKEFKLM
ncbi:sigma-70 family RNA polymerase sigma factor [Pedobacter sp. MC2016-15]|uniref:RNA polymerase sigma factor n=1 Tax=Pedobacter sp. MC2016-15 TaxID=2994473 RepID=UPI002244FF87|nr:sigma-70 family RNA polymerase sigma factor [Pedobacter sp. MC2016-15]MCX2477629.1 sigma-70 family RNA polymerase sigma factor [Pedobacter sp. MC2016-15]